MSAAPERSLQRYAVFVTHGMGQQVPFATVSELVSELRKEPELSGIQPSSQMVLLNNQRMHRVSLRLATRAREIHFYEGYWAPKTEGVVKLRDVMGFLLRAGLNGLKNSEGVFRRWAFGTSQVYPIPVRTWIYLVIAVATIAALVSMNAVIAVVSAAQLALEARPSWLTDRLLEDLTTTLDIFLLTAVLFALTLLVATKIRRVGRPTRNVSGILSLLTLVLTVFSAILAGFLLPVLVLVHARSGQLPASQVTFWGYLLGPVWASRLSAGSAMVIGVSVVVLILWYVVRPWLRILYRALREQLGSWAETENRQQQPSSSLLVLFLLVVLVGLLAIELGTIWSFSRSLGPTIHWPTRLLLTWLVLIGISAVVRYFLVQYVGDVAAYVSSHSLDRFADVRQEIKDCVYEAAQAVYAASGAFAYDAVILLGHSLGSLVSYDILNRLINEDELQREAGGTVLNVAQRTRLFLTFGSPMDKTAFIFAIQTGRTNPTREALAATMQPMIQDYRFRPMRWVNIYSPWDIISGALNYYDVKDTASPSAVENLPDPDATTLLAAHTEYWGNPLLRRTLTDVLIA